jgi:hypothetical protein
VSRYDDERATDDRRRVKPTGDDAVMGEAEANAGVDDRTSADYRSQMCC